MSTGDFIHSIPARFREERENLGFSRPELAKALDVSVDTVKNWEGTRSSPNAIDLAKFQDIGADVMYILMGRRVRSVVEQDLPAHAMTPAKQLAAKVGALSLAAEDVDILLALARRLEKSG